MNLYPHLKHYPYFFHDVGGNGEQMYPLREGWTGWDQGSGDLALWGCFGELFFGSELRPFPLIEPFGTTDDHNDAFFVASGWPGEKAIAIPHAREYRTTLHTVMGKPVLRSDLDDDSFAFNCANDISYYGMSGSPVWNLNFHRCATPDEWMPCQIRSC